MRFFPCLKSNIASYNTFFCKHLKSEGGGGGVKADCLTRDLGLLVECPPWRVILRDPSSYLREFRRKLWKTPNDQVNGDRTWHLASTCFECRAAQPLVGQVM